MCLTCETGGIFATTGGVGAAAATRSATRGVSAPAVAFAVAPTTGATTRAAATATTAFAASADNWVSHHLCGVQLLLTTLSIRGADQTILSELQALRQVCLPLLPRAAGCLPPRHTLHVRSVEPLTSTLIWLGYSLTGEMTVWTRSAILASYGACSLACSIDQVPTSGISYGPTETGRIVASRTGPENNNFGGVY